MEYDWETEENERCGSETKSNISSSLILQTNVGNSGDLNHHIAQRILGRCRELNCSRRWPSHTGICYSDLQSFINFSSV